MNPTKEQVRKWLFGRQQSRAPLPSPDELRRQLGWTYEPKPKNAKVGPP